MDSKRRKHLGLTENPIPCSGRPGCKFFQVYAVNGCCTNCNAALRRTRPHVKELEKQNKNRYLAKPGKKEHVSIRKRDRCRETGYYQDPEYKEKKKAYYTSEHGRRLYAARTAKRRAEKKRATPPWLTTEQIDQIKKFYLICPKGHEVDHIVPINGKNVCGLHVPWNLQILTKEENCRKSNSHEDLSYANTQTKA